jgi:branched-chain amino acid transport system permease protein
MLTLAQASFFAVGAYCLAILTTVFGWGTLPAIGVAFIAAAVLSLVISLPSWRVRRDFFVLVTLAVQVLMFSAANNWFDPRAAVGSLSNLTNGSFGIVGIPNPTLLGIRIDGIFAQAILASAIAAASAYLIWRLKASPWGRLLVAMRDDELALRGLGKNTRWLKVQAVAFSCAFAAIAGAIYAGYAGYIDPSSAALDQSILILSMVLVGGSGNFVGPVVGAALLVATPEILRAAQFPDALAAQLRLMLYGIMLLLLMHFRPSGVAGTYRIE